jgi:hypothetical protein
MHRIHHTLILLLTTFAVLFTTGCQIGGVRGSRAQTTVNPPATAPI